MPSRCEQLLKPGDFLLVTDKLTSSFVDLDSLRDFIDLSCARRIRELVNWNGAKQKAVSTLRETAVVHDILDELLVDLAKAVRRQDVWSLAWDIVSRVSDERDNRKQRLLTDLALLETCDTDCPVVGQGSLESLTSADPFLDPGPLTQWIERVKKQVCQIRCGGTESGTGFLVAPTLILTCSHVVQTHIAAGRRAKIEVRFDYHDAAMNSAWRHVDPDWEILHAPASEADERPDRGAEPGTSELDFAILRMPSLMGEERGYFRISDADNLPMAGTPVFIAGHPGPTAPLQPLRISMAAPGVDGLNANRTRIRYRASTLPGSSGSPVFDRQFQPIALHNSRGEAGAGGFRRNNRGIPLSAICRHLGVSTLADLGQQPTIKAVESVTSPEATTESDSRDGSQNPTSVPHLPAVSFTVPFIGRNTLRSRVEDLCSGKSHVLVVDGKPKSGRTFSRQYIETAVAHRGDRFVPISLIDPRTRLSVSANSMAEEAATFCGWSRDNLAEVLSRDRETLGRRLATWIVGRCQESPGKVWFVIDDCDHAGVAPEVTQLLIGLLEQSQQAGRMRLVFLGINNEIGRVLPQHTVFESIELPTEEDCREFMRAFTREIQQPLNENILASVVGRLWDRLPHGDELFLRVLSLEIQVEMLRMQMT